MGEDLTPTKQIELTPLGKLVEKLAKDPKALKSFREDPDAAMKAAGLTAIEVAAMKSKDPQVISQALGGKRMGAQMEQFVIRDAIVIVI